MAAYGETSLRYQVPPQSSSSRGKSISDRSNSRRKSGQSLAASSFQSNENRPAQDRRADIADRAQSPQSRSVSSPRRPPLRTIPAWVRQAEDDQHGTVSAPPLPSHPDGARIAEHHFAPHAKERFDWNGEQSQTEGRTRESRWKTLARSTAYPRDPLLEENIVSYEWLNQNFGDYSEPWQGKEETDLESGRRSLDFIQRRKLWMSRLQHKILHSPIVPLIIRLTVFSFCVAALGLGASIRNLSTKFNRPQGASTDIAIIVDAVAPVYLVYITYDEYTGKPLGLRPARAKMRLIFLDLFFIVFASANLSLAFESISSLTGSCMAARINDSYDPKNDPICVRQKALASVLLVALIAWLMTFAISVLRVVERVSGKG
ncbi:hypothetical protein VTO42DRAFT_2938 [Malbranchea cinnamomea]